MKTVIFTMTALAAVVSLTSCTKDGGEVSDLSKHITINAGIGTLTRATSTAFEVDDEISVYAWTGDKTAVPTDLVVSNSINKYDGTKWVATPLMLWKDMTSNHYFIGVYPKKAIVDFTADSYAVASDVLVATVLDEGRVASKGIVPMVFDHVMAKLIVNLTFRTQFDKPTVSSVTTEAKSGATVNHLTKTATAVGTATDVALATVTANSAYAGVLASQTINKIDITIDSKVYTYNNSEGFTLEAGKVQTVNLIVGRDEITLGSITINPWGSGDTIDGGEAQQDE